MSEKQKAPQNCRLARNKFPSAPRLKTIGFGINIIQPENFVNVKYSMREEKIAVLIKAFESSGLKRGAFARAIKVAPGYISDILNGKDINPSDSLVELARITFLTPKPTQMSNSQKDQLIETQGKLIKKLEAEIAELKRNS